MEVIQLGVHSRMTLIKEGIYCLLDDADRVVWPSVQVGTDLGKNILRHIVEGVAGKNLCTRQKWSVHHNMGPHAMVSWSEDSLLAHLPWRQSGLQQRQHGISVLSTFSILQCILKDLRQTALGASHGLSVWRS